MLLDAPPSLPQASTPGKTPLTDSFGRLHTYLRISVTDRCNLRCRYCMPKEGIRWKEREELLTFEELYRVARIFVSLGIRKIRLTGGEPLVRHGLEDLVEQLSTLPGLDGVSLTTNGVLLAQKASVLKKAGLSGLNVSLDTLRPERFETLTHRDHFHETQAGLHAALDAGFLPLKLNVVVLKGFNDDEILDFVDYVKDKPINVRFIEFMPFKANRWHQDCLLPYAEIKARIQACYPLVPKVAPPSAVAKDFIISGFQGSVSFITSMTNDFCGTCNRVRLTADGDVKSCLFHPAETSLRDALRHGATDGELEALIRQAVWQKKEGHAPMADIDPTQNLSMIQIGG